MLPASPRSLDRASRLSLCRLMHPPQAFRTAAARPAAQRSIAFRSSMVEPELPLSFRSSMVEPELPLSFRSSMTDPPLRS